MYSAPHLLPLAWCAMGFLLLNWGEVPASSLAYMASISLGWSGLSARGAPGGTWTERPSRRSRGGLGRASVRRATPCRAPALAGRRIRRPASPAMGRCWPLDSPKGPPPAAGGGHAGIAELLRRHGTPMRPVAMRRWGVIAPRGSHRVA